ncbi:dienelactone hydrolase family protein [Changchengzhania lutea]|uniref:dienelactone hydrolase family protein n=1 Tax=Changchengzhania lutea TaxID=2049305 RepID=UPI00115E627C|nr:alpha/beta hydrolase [Changchengzhania lutea]
MKTIYNTYKDINIPISEINLMGRIRHVKNQKGLIIFSHGSGSSRLSSRNNYVADLLQQNGFSSLLFDLLTEAEDTIYENRFDINLFAQRLIHATTFMAEQDRFTDAAIGYFGASTGAASALYAASELGNKIKAIVSRGGRPDLALPILHKIKCATLLIVGGDDDMVIELNQKAYSKLAGIKKIEIVEGATHLFSEPGKLEEVARLTNKWFDKYLK